MRDINSDALRIILAKRRTVAEVVKLLMKKDYDEEEAFKAAQHYRERGYIDHEDYARRFVHDAAKIRGLGPVRIATELKNRGIEEEIANAAIESMEFNLKELMVKKYGQDGEINFKMAQKIKNHYFYKGFAANEVNQALRELYTLKWNEYE